jgi:RNA polymerase sigma-70 factor (ECF subfamily)
MPARSCTFGSGRRLGCNGMARPVFRIPGAAQTAAPRIVHLDHDRPLLEAARRDPARFEALYRRYLAPVYSFAYYELGNHHAAEDATARTFLAALANLHRFEERARPGDGEGASTFKVWLFQIARNVIANERRSTRRHPTEPLDEPTGAIVADPLDVEGDVVRRDEAAAAWRAVGRLPGDRRRALILRFVDELSTAEIAGVMGRSEGAVRVLLHRALRTVARDLGSRGGAAGSGAAGTRGR